MSSAREGAARFPDRPLRAAAVAAARAWRADHPLDPATHVVDELLLLVAHCQALLEDGGLLTDPAAPR